MQIQFSELIENYKFKSEIFSLESQEMISSNILEIGFPSYSMSETSDKYFHEHINLSFTDLEKQQMFLDRFSEEFRDTSVKSIQNIETEL